VQNDIRFAVIDMFGQENIEIPSTPRAVIAVHKPEPWPTDDDKTEMEFAEREKERAEAAAKRKTVRRRGRKPDPG
jgi:small-conductance mechanosensitive channel